MLSQGLKKGVKAKDESDDEESESEEESEEEEEEFIPLGNKRSQQSNGDSYSKKQKLDNAASELTMQ